MDLVPAYRRRSSVLHATRASVALAYCGALALPALLFWPNPVATGATIVAILTAAAGARVGRAVTGAVRAAIAVALLVTAVNVLVTQHGTTVILRAGTLFGHRFDFTLESLAWGAMTGLSLAALWLAGALYTVAVDPDEMLRTIRRGSHRSALTAALATRLVPVLARDSRRLGEAARCRAVPPGRWVIIRATLAGALERAVDVAAALEVRGYGLPGRPTSPRRPWSRHDTRVGLVAAALVAVTLAAKAAGAAAVTVDPTLSLAFGPADATLTGAILLAGAVPFLGAGARLGVAHG